MPELLSRKVFALGCGLAVLAGCGGSDADRGPATLSPAPSVEPPSANKLAGRVLQAADLPAGWVGQPQAGEADGTATAAAMLTCVGAPNTVPTKPTDALVQKYTQGNASISSQVSTYGAQSDIDADLAALNHPKASACYEKAFRKELAASLPAGASIDAAPITITPGSNGGPFNVVSTGEGVISVDSNGRKVTIYLNIAFVSGPQIEGEIDFTSVGSPVPAETQKALVAIFAQRAAGE